MIRLWAKAKEEKMYDNIPKEKCYSRKEFDDEVSKQVQALRTKVEFEHKVAQIPLDMTADEARSIADKIMEPITIEKEKENLFKVKSAIRRSVAEGGISYEFYSGQYSEVFPTDRTVEVLLSLGYKIKKQISHGYHSMIVSWGNKK